MKELLLVVFAVSLAASAQNAETTLFKKINNNHSDDKC